MEGANMSDEWNYEGYHSLRERKFNVNGNVYTLFEYGEEFYKDSNKDDLSRDDIEDWALKNINDLMNQKNNVIVELR
jgi:hypothetical protein